MNAIAFLWVFLGGGVGACARFGLGTLIARWAGTAFPTGTLLINVTGSFLIGLVGTVLIEREVADPAWRLALVTGVLGGYTTFSAFGYETVSLVEAGQGGRALLYVLATNALGIAACVAGVALVRVLVTRPV